MGQTEESLLGGMSASSLQLPQVGPIFFSKDLLRQLTWNKTSFDLEPPDPQLDDFFFGDPAAWTFEHVW